MPNQGADECTYPAHHEPESQDSPQRWIAVVVAVVNVRLIASGARHGVGIRAEGKARENAWYCPDQKSFQRAFRRVLVLDSSSAFEGNGEGGNLCILLHQETPVGHA